MSYNPQLGRADHTGPVRVFVWADDALAADGLRDALANDARLDCVPQLEAAHVVLWDAGALPAQSTETMRAVLSAARTRSQAVVVLVADELVAARALHDGAQGIVARRIHGPTLTAAIVAVHHGLCVLDSAVADHYLELPNVAAAEGGKIDPLTAREREVLALLALGLTNKTIAQRLVVSVHTIKFHVNSILAKLGADSRTAAVSSALRRGLVTL
jgi:two-component system, NarL family, nitrate/nitrite response regulator NarL